MVCQEDPLIRTVCDLYQKISALDSLSPCKEVNSLFSQLVRACIPPHPLDVSNLCSKVHEIRSRLIRLCGAAEGLLEAHYSALLGSTFDRPLDHLSLFPYYENYIKLAELEHSLLSDHLPGRAGPARVAFVGSGPLPLTTIVLALRHLPNAVFHNYDIDPVANSLGRNLVLPDPDLSKRVLFHTDDIMNVTDPLADYDVVFLAALVGMAEEDKARIVAHLAKYMAPGSILMVRSAHGARAFLYPVVDPNDLGGFEFLTVYHPTDEVINSVVVARRLPDPNPTTGPTALTGQHVIKKIPIASKKCCENIIQPFFDRLNPYGNIADDLAIEEKSS